MNFRAKLSTGDGRITKGRTYKGDLVHIQTAVSRPPPATNLRIAVYDNRQKWMTFDPDIFEPAEVRP